MTARGAGVPEQIRTNDPDFDPARALVRVPLSPGLLCELLGIPDDHEIIGCRWNFDVVGGEIELIVEGCDLPVVHFGQVIPRVVPTITVDWSQGKAVRSWDWNLDNMEDRT